VATFGDILIVAKRCASMLNNHSLTVTAPANLAAKFYGRVSVTP
jgi:hypothetical protein